MARMNRRTGHTTGESKHVRRYAWMLKSQAYRSLTCYARCLLEELQLRFDGTNNGAIFFSVRQAAEALACSVPTAMKAFQALQERQFIIAKDKGAFSRKTRHATTWTLTEYLPGDDARSKAFMRWEPPAKIQNTVQRRLTDSATTFNRGPRKHPQKPLHGATTFNRQPGLGGSHGATSFNTSSLPPEAEPKGNGRALETSLESSTPKKLAVIRRAVITSKPNGLP